jgi:hypothetical protein
MEGTSSLLEISDPSIKVTQTVDDDDDEDDDEDDDDVEEEEEEEFNTCMYVCT